MEGQKKAGWALTSRFSVGWGAQPRRAVDRISQKVLTNRLRSLERDGIVTRRIYASIPPNVEYSLIDLGRSLCGLVGGICVWAEANIEQVQQARTVYEEAAESLVKNRHEGS
jgi:DNA-binding HxlR family transcriptional regulator